MGEFIIKTLLQSVAGFAVLFILFVPIEKLFALRREQRTFRAGFRTDMLHFLFTRLLVDAAVFVPIAFLFIVLRNFVDPSFQAAVMAQPFWLKIVEGLVIVEMGGYIGHRLSHQVPLLWRFHAVHHSSEEMDWLASLRIHPLDGVVTKALQFAPLFLMGFSAGMLGGFAVLLRLYAVFIHSNVRFKLGKLRWLFTSPEFHHWHHAGTHEAKDKNFAGLSPLVDVLFGTAYMPEGAMPERYGVKEPMPQGYFGQLAYPFKRAA